MHRTKESGQVHGTAGHCLHCARTARSSVNAGTNASTHSCLTCAAPHVRHQHARPPPPTQQPPHLRPRRRRLEPRRLWHIRRPLVLEALLAQPGGGHHVRQGARLPPHPAQVLKPVLRGALRRVGEFSRRHSSSASAAAHTPTQSPAPRPRAGLGAHRGARPPPRPSPARSLTPCAAESHVSLRALRGEAAFQPLLTWTAHHSRARRHPPHPTPWVATASRRAEWGAKT